MKEKQLTETEKKLYKRLRDERMEYERQLGVKEYEIAKYERAYDDIAMKEKISDKLVVVSLVMQIVILAMIAVVRML